MVDSWRTGFRRQLDIFTQSATERSTGLQELLSTRTSQENLAHHVNFLKSSFEKGLSNFQEFSDYLAKPTSEATDPLAKFIDHSLANVKEVLAKYEIKLART